MNSLNKKFILKKIFLSVILLLLLCTLSYIAWFYWLGRNINLKYTASDLGISFYYQPITDSGEIVHIKKLENKIYVFTNTWSEENAAYAEIVNLEENFDIQKAMQVYIKQHFQNDDCFQVYNTQGIYEEGTKWEVVCDSPHGALGHQNYFLYNKDNPNKFAFFNIDLMGENGFVYSKNWVKAANGRFWFSTFRLQ